MSAPFNEMILQYGAPTAAFLAALLGSGHCASMCGPVLFAARLASGRQAVAYHSARLGVYAAFGAAAGALGSSLFSAQYGRSVMAMATAVALSMFVAVALRPVLAWLAPRFFRALPQAEPMSGLFRPALVGIGTALLPCGWLHIFVAAAAATGDARRGALLMVAFGLGTIPSLMISDWAFKKLGARFKHRLAVLFLMVAVGASMALKISPLLASEGTPQAELSCHH